MTLLRDAILDHIQAMSFDRLPSDVVAKTSALVADGLASALIGSADSNAKTFRDIQLTHYGFGGVPVWGTDHLLGWIGAGMVNGFHCHVSHCAGVHDATQIEAAPVIVPAVMAYADRFGQIPGKDIITAVNIGVDVSVLLAHASAKKERFDRSSMCGVLGAGVALAKLEQMDRPTTAALSITNWPVPCCRTRRQIWDRPCKSHSLCATSSLLLISCASILPVPPMCLMGRAAILRCLNGVETPRRFLTVSARSGGQKK